MTTENRKNAASNEPLVGTESQPELESLALALEAGLSQGDLKSFYQRFRSSHLPFLSGRFARDTASLFRECFAVLHRLGGISAAAAIAVENHYYVSSAIATFPASGQGLSAARIQAVHRLLNEKRLLVANTNAKVHSGKLGEFGVKARRERGGFLISGYAAYTSLATEADLLVFIAQIEGERPAVFFTESLQGNQAIEIGPYLFPNAMIESDTRSITFRELFVPAENVIAPADDEQSEALFAFEMAWHQLLIPVVYLGAAARAIEEARRFLRETRGRDGNPLSELDGMIIDMGRLVLEYDAASSSLWLAARALADVRELPRDAGRLKRAVELSSVAKYTGTRAAEAIVGSARKIIGARVFVGNHVLSRLSQEVMFGPLGPEVSAVIERRAGRQALSELPFLGSNSTDFRRSDNAQTNAKGDA
ncbi:MAG TPA: acyl-CoA dehydrogenase family protein [Polyangiaceae bacterium]|nr:acyl-CoA dehydrogenase family protein [Polyangiaceae bacterium]